MYAVSLAMALFVILTNFRWHSSFSKLSLSLTWKGWISLILSRNSVLRCIGSNVCLICMSNCQSLGTALSPRFCTLTMKLSFVGQDVVGIHISFNQVVIDLLSRHVTIAGVNSIITSLRPLRTSFLIMNRPLMVMSPTTRGNWCISCKLLLLSLLGMSTRLWMLLLRIEVGLICIDLVQWWLRLLCLWSCGIWSNALRYHYKQIRTLIGSIMNAFFVNKILTYIFHLSSNCFHHTYFG